MSTLLGISFCFPSQCGSFLKGQNLDADHIIKMSEDFKQMLVVSWC